MEVRICVEKYRHNNKTQYERLEGFVSIAKEGDKAYRFFANLPNCVSSAVHSGNLLFYNAIGVCKVKTTSWGYTPLDGSRLTESIDMGRKLEWDEIKGEISNYFSMIENEDEYKNAVRLGYEVFAREKFSKKAMELGHSETFAKVVYQRKNDKELYDKMIALNEEGISKDMIAYLMFK